MAFAIIFRAGLGVDAEFRFNCSVLIGTVESMCLLAVSPDGNWLAASGTSAGVHVYSVKRLKVSFGFNSSKQEEVSPEVTRPKANRHDPENYETFFSNQEFFLFYSFRT